MGAEIAPEVAIIVLTWNGVDYTRACLESLRARTPVGAGGIGQVVFFGADDRGAVYREWQDEYGTRVVRLDDLVTGTADQLTKWFGEDRIPVNRVSSRGVIAGNLPLNDERFVLFEVEVP